MSNRKIYMVVLMMVAGLFIAQSASAYSILVTPQDAIVKPGAGLDFEAQAFSDDHRPVGVDKYQWNVMPKSLGTISEDGYFEAGDQVGAGTVTATAMIGGQRYTGMAVVQVGAPPEAGIKIIVEPKQAIVEPGAVQNFKAIAQGPNGVSLRTQHVRWMVQPNTLGSINANGQFKAANRYGIGTVVALVEIDHQVYLGHASVIVSEKPSSAIAGTVVDEGANALEGVKITATRIGALPYHRRAETAADGTYFLGKLIPGYYVVKAELKGYVTEYYDDKTFLMEATPVQVAEEDTVAAIDFDLEKGGSISGMVTLSEDGSPLSNANVTAFLLLNPLKIYHTMSDSAGEYTIEGLHSGAYIVRANKAGYIGEYYDDSKRLLTATPVNVERPNDTPNIDFALDQTSAITGTISSDVDGSPIEGAVVYVRALITDRPQVMGNRIMKRTDENGQYTVQVKPGIYVVEAFAEGYASEWYQDAQKPSEATPVTVTDDEHAVVDMSLAPLGSLAGMVTDQDTGLPLVGARVKVFNEKRPDNHRRFFEAITDDTGAYKFEALPAGEYFVLAYAREYLPEFWQEADSLKNAEKVVIENNSETTGIDFTLTKGSTIAGTVTDQETSAPIPGSVVTLKKLDGRLKLATKTDPGGNYNFFSLPSGLYVLNANHKEYHKEWYNEKEDFTMADTVVVTAPDVLEGINFTLLRKEEAGAGISGLVIDSATEMPIDGAMVAVVPLTFAMPKRTVTGEDGSFEILGLRPGRYLVLAHAQGYKGEFFDDAKNWFNATPVTVQDGQVTPDINFALDPQEEGAYMIAGTVTDDNGDPVAGALVVAQDDQGVVATDVSDDDGSYQMTSVPAGKYKVTASTASFDSDTGSEQTVELENGENQYGVALSLNSSTTGIGANESVPTDYSLEQNYPNPFNPTTMIQYSLPQDSHVKLTIYNLLGREVRVLYSGARAAGTYTANWDGRDDYGNKLSSGLYIYRLQVQSGDKVSVYTRRMMMLK